ncbi:alpha/beta fold hydrolase [Mycetohabitans sp. B2]|nr:alpha/beta fold hydrolase [Mycetohabitans sp. B2]
MRHRNFAALGGDGPPLLLLHGHPQTHLIWHCVAPQLAKRFTVIAADLHGYGASSKPAADDPQHVLYAKRTMAADLVQVMHELGHKRFFICAHDGNRATGFPLNKPLHYIPFNLRMGIQKNEIRVPVALQ